MPPPTDETWEGKDSGGPHPALDGEVWVAAPELGKGIEVLKETPRCPGPNGAERSAVPGGAQLCAASCFSCPVTASALGMGSEPLL